MSSLASWSRRAPVSATAASRSRQARRSAVARPTAAATSGVPGASTTLLAPADDERGERDLAAHAERADADGTTELVPADRDEVRARGRGREVEPRRRGDRVGVHHRRGRRPRERARRAPGSGWTVPTSLFAVITDTRSAPSTSVCRGVEVHDAVARRPAARPPSTGAASNPRASRRAASRTAWCSIDETTRRAGQATPRAVRGDAEDRHVARLGAAAGEHDATGQRARELGDLLARVVEREARSPSTRGASPVGFPTTPRMYGAIASSTSGRLGADAAWSKYRTGASSRCGAPGTSLTWRPRRTSSRS